MRFVVTRTSVWGNKTPPCANAYYVESEELPHWKEYGWHTWYIDISSLEELLNFQKEVGKEIIVYRSDDITDAPFEIEIYDTWRE